MNEIDKNLERLGKSSNPEDKQIYDYITKTEKMLQVMNELRGQYISWSISLESLLENIIATHFGIDARSYQLMNSLILRELMLQKKIKIFNKLLRHEYPDLQSRYSTLKAKLEKIPEFRNDLAHDPPYLDADILAKYDGQSVFITKFENDEKTYREITKQEIDEQIGLIQVTCGDLMTILFFVRKRRENVKVISIETGQGNPIES